MPLHWQEGYITNPFPEGTKRGGVYRAWLWIYCTIFGHFNVWKKTFILPQI